MNSLPKKANTIISILRRQEFKILFVAILSLALVTGCSKNAKSEGGAGTGAKKISVITTIFPEHEWVRALTEGSDFVSIKTLVKKGTDIHNYEPSTPDLIAIQKADLFIYVGGQTDFWVDEVLKKSANKEQIVLNLTQALDNYGNDEHIWLSVTKAKKSVAKIADALVALDSKNADLYKTNLKNYTERLDALEQQVRKISVAAKSAREKNSLTHLFFCDRFYFKPLLDDLGLDYYAPEDEGSQGSDSSFENVSFLVTKAQQLKPKAIFVAENSDFKLANTVISGAKLTGVKIVSLNSMQVLKNQGQAEGDYISLMQDNLTKIRSVIDLVE